jgi:hypothetical protein
MWMRSSMSTERGSSKTLAVARIEVVSARESGGVSSWGRSHKC